MSIATKVLRDLIGGPYHRNAPYCAVIVLLLSALAISAWIVWGDLTHRNGEKEERKEKEATVTLAFTLDQLGQRSWRVGELVPSKGSSVFTARVVDGQDRVIFDLKVDGTTGEPIPRGAEEEIGANPATSAITPTDMETLRARASDVLTRLAMGQAKTKGRGAFIDVELTYKSRRVATLRVDPQTNTIIAKGERARPEAKGPEKPKGKKARLVPGNLVQPLGWLATMVAIVSTLYYSWRRAQTMIIRESPGAAKAPAIQRLRSLLLWHEVFGFLALGLAVLHLVDFWHKLQVSTSWLLFFMMVTVVLSGLFREVMGRFQAVRTYWRSFHIPYTFLFFAVLVVHVLMKLELLGKD